MGASLLVFSNKTDVEACMAAEEIRRVLSTIHCGSGLMVLTSLLGASTGHDQDSQMDHSRVQRHHREQPRSRARMGGTGCPGQAFLILKPARLQLLPRQSTFGASPEKAPMLGRRCGLNSFSRWRNEDIYSRRAQGGLSITEAAIHE